MSDVSPSPVKAAKPDQKKQLIMVAVLGVVLLFVLVFMVLKPFGGGDTSAPPAPAVTAPAVDAGTGATAAPAAPAEATTEASEPAPPPARPARTPFDPPR